MRKSRPMKLNPNGLEKQRQWLEKRHTSLKTEVRALEARHLDSSEHSRWVELKKEKLAVKDALYAMRND